MDIKRKYLELQCSICGIAYLEQERVFKKARWKYRCSAHRKIIKFCPDCKKQIWDKNTKCKSCSQKGNVKFCIDCGKILSKQAKIRCIKCHNIFQDKGLLRERTKFQNSKFWITIRTPCLKRDNFTCKLCGVKSGCGKTVYLEVHHIKSWNEFPKLRLDKDKLITLCKSCHKNVHRKGGDVNESLGKHSGSSLCQRLRMCQTYKSLAPLT